MYSSNSPASVIALYISPPSSALPHSFCSFRSSTHFPKSLFNYITPASFVYIASLSTPSPLISIDPSTGWPEVPLQNARLPRLRFLPTRSSPFSTRLPLPLLPLHQILKTSPSWLAARTLCAVALRQRFLCPSPTLPPPTASAKQKRESVYTLVNIPVAARYALFSPDDSIENAIR